MRIAVLVNLQKNAPKYDGMPEDRWHDLDSERTLAYHGLATPEFQVFTRPGEALHGELLNEDGELRFPLFIKPSAEGTSMGVSSDSIVHTVTALRKEVNRQLAHYQQPILA